MTQVLYIHQLRKKDVIKDFGRFALAAMGFPMEPDSCCVSDETEAEI